MSLAARGEGTVRATELRDLWRSIVRPSRGGLAGRRVPGAAGHRVIWVATDSGGTPHLLIEVPVGTSSVSLERTRGIDVSIDEFRIGEGHPGNYLALACLDEAHADTFSALCAELVDLLSSSTRDPLEVVPGTIAHWRRFWDAPRARLSREECLGLFGELWFLDRWIGPVIGIDRWTGSGGARHDFQWTAASVEVKASAIGSHGRPVHRIAGLEQLDDPETGSLYLFSLHAMTDELSSNTLPSAIERIRRSLIERPDLVDRFLEKLSQRGYSPADDESYGFRWRILSEELYHVGEGFPRLTRGGFAGGVPNGIGDVRYALDLAACGAWLVACVPTAAEAAFLKAE